MRLHCKTAKMDKSYWNENQWFPDSGGTYSP